MLLHESCFFESEIQILSFLFALLQNVLVQQKTEPEPFYKTSSTYYIF